MAIYGNIFDSDYEGEFYYRTLDNAKLNPTWNRPLTEQGRISYDGASEGYMRYFGRGGLTELVACASDTNIKHPELTSTERACATVIVSYRMHLIGERLESSLIGSTFTDEEIDFRMSPYKDLGVWSS